MTSPFDPEELKIPAYKRKRSLNARAKHPLAWTARDRQKEALEKETGRMSSSTSRGFGASSSTGRVSGQTNVHGTERRARPEKPEVVQPQNAFGSTQPSRQLSSYHRIQTPSMNMLNGMSGDIGSIVVDDSAIPDEISSVKSTARSARSVKRVMTPEPRDAHESSFQRLSLEQTSILDRREAVEDRRVAISSVPRQYVLVGEVTMILGKISVAILKLSQSIRLNDMLLFEGEQCMYEEVIREMQIDRKNVKTAKKNAEIGVKMEKLPKNATKIYRVVL